MFTNIFSKRKLWWPDASIEKKLKWDEVKWNGYSIRDKYFCFYSRWFLANLGKRINSAINNAISNTQDDFAISIDVMLRSIATALLESDFNNALVSSLRNNIRNKLLDKPAKNSNKSMTDAQTKKSWFIRLSLMNYGI